MKQLLLTLSILLGLSLFVSAYDYKKDIVSNLDLSDDESFAQEAFEEAVKDNQDAQVIQQSQYGEFIHYQPQPHAYIPQSQEMSTESSQPLEHRHHGHHRRHGHGHHGNHGHRGHHRRHSHGHHAHHDHQKQKDYHHGHRPFGRHFDDWKLHHRQFDNNKRAFVNSPISQNNIRNSSKFDSIKDIANSFFNFKTSIYQAVLKFMDKENSNQKQPEIQSDPLVVKDLLERNFSKNGRSQSLTQTHF